MGCAASYALLAYGSDQISAGATAIWTGEGQVSLGAQALMTLGLSADDAEMLYGLAVAGLEGAALRQLIANPRKISITYKALATNRVLNVPGRVQSRVNLANGSTRYTPMNDVGNPVASGWDHVASRHFGGTNTQSQFTPSQSEVRGILQSDRVVSAPVTEVKMINGTPTYVRTVDVG